MILTRSRRKLWLDIWTIKRALVAEWDGHLGGTTGSGDGSSASETLCTLIAVLCATTKHLVERSFDEGKENNELENEQDGHEGLFGAIGLCPVSGQIVPKGIGNGCLRRHGNRMYRVERS